LAYELEALRNEDERLRVQFAKAFSRFKRRNTAWPVDDNSEPEDITWEDVFVEIGRLLAARNFTDLEGNISEIETKIEDLERKLEPSE
jgi:hypothetical protein